MTVTKRSIQQLTAAAGCSVSIIALYFILLYTGIVLHPAAVCVISCALGTAFWMLRKQEKHYGIKKKPLIYLFSLAFSIFFILDQRIVHTGSFAATISEAYLKPFGKTEAAMTIVTSIFVFQMVRSLFVMISMLLRKLPEKAARLEKAAGLFVTAKHFQLWTFLVLMMSWSVFWLTYFPGTGVNDTLWIWNNPLGSSIQHTLTYNYLFYGLMSLGKLIGGSWFWGVALYSFVQMLFCAWVVSHVLKWLAQRNVPRLLVIAVFMFFAFSRIVANVSVLSVKDTIFSFTLLLLIPLLYDCAESEGRSLLQPRNLLLFIFTSAMTVLIRNNGIFVMTGVAVMIVIVCRKHWKSMLALCLAVVILPYAADTVLMKTLVKREKIAVESLAIPLQQMAAVVARDGEMSEDEAAVMDTIMPLEQMRERYRPTSTDSLKWGEGAQYLNKNWIAENQGLFLKTWAGMLEKNIDIYIEAYLLETLSYWNIGEPSKSQGLYYTFPQSASVDLEVENKRVFPEAIQEGLQRYYRIDANQKSPSCGTMIWLLLFMMVYLICTQQGRKALCFLPVVFVWGTIMVSAPVAYSFRYILSLYLACPFLAASLAADARHPYA